MVHLYYTQPQSGTKSNMAALLLPVRFYSYLDIIAADMKLIVLILHAIRDGKQLDYPYISGCIFLHICGFPPFFAP